MKECKEEGAAPMATRQIDVKMEQNGHSVRTIRMARIRTYLTYAIHKDTKTPNVRTHLGRISDFANCYVEIVPVPT